MRIKKPIQLKFSPRIKGNDYVRIPGSNIVIAREEHYKGLDHQDTLSSLSEDKKIMPPTSLFMPYFVSVIEANNGERTLYDASNKPLPPDEVEELCKKLTTNSWIWLNNYFCGGSQGKLLNGSFIDFKKKGDKQILTLERTPLEQCVMEDCIVELEFNSQGLPIKKSNEQKYEQGKNIRFLYPRKNTVAGFGADSDRAGLDCGWNPAYSGEGLGVFDCAKGAPKN